MSEIVRLKIADIIITPDRQRKGIGEGRDAEKRLADLAASMAKRHLNPITVREDNTLVAGYRRLCAAKLNGWAEIDAKYESDMSDLEREEMELDENIHRLDLTWQERVDALARLHELRRAQDPSWGQRETAAQASVHQRDVSEALQLKKMMELFPELKKADSIAQAKTFAKRIADTKLRTLEVATNGTKDYSDIEEKLILGDATELIKSLPDESFRLILTDPPFGIDYDQKIAGSSVALTTYDDGTDLYTRILGMAPDLYRVLKPDGFLIWFCGFSWYEECKRVLRAAGFTVDEIPDLWDRSDGKCFTTNPDQLFPKGYDIALHCYKGKPTVVKRRKSNVFRYPSVDGALQSVERPVDLYADYIEHLTLRGEMVADFFAGSGSVAAACEKLGRDWWSCELDPDRRARAVIKIKSFRPEGK